MRDTLFHTKQNTEIDDIPRSPFNMESSHGDSLCGNNLAHEFIISYLGVVSGDSAV